MNDEILEVHFGLLSLDLGPVDVHHSELLLWVQMLHVEFIQPAVRHGNSQGLRVSQYLQLVQQIREQQLHSGGIHFHCEWKNSTRHVLENRLCSIGQCFHHNGHFDEWLFLLLFIVCIHARYLCGCVRCECVSDVSFDL